MAYAAIVFPASSSPHRLRIKFTDKLADSASLLILAVAGQAVARIISS